MSIVTYKTIKSMIFYKNQMFYKIIPISAFKPFFFVKSMQVLIILRQGK